MSQPSSSSASGTDGVAAYSNMADAMGTLQFFRCSLRLFRWASRCYIEGFVVSPMLYYDSEMPNIRSYGELPALRKVELQRW